MKKVIPGSDMDFIITGAQSRSSGSYYNSATATFVVNDIAGTEVISSQTLTYVTSSNGNYLGTIDKAVFSAALTEGQEYVAIFTAVQSGVDRNWELKFKYGY